MHGTDDLNVAGGDDEPRKPRSPDSHEIMGENWPKWARPRAPRATLRGRERTLPTARRKHGLLKSDSGCSNDPRCSRGKLVHRVDYRHLWIGHWPTLFVETR
jgi:hypothetical protein